MPYQNNLYIEIVTKTVDGNGMRQNVVNFDCAPTLCTVSVCEIVTS